MRLEDAIQFVLDRFPFPGYMTPGSLRGGAYTTVANVALRYLPPGSTILDFGCGPCDKTAILQRLGFRCSGYDDLQDAWHKNPETRETILRFTRECGVDFWLAQDGALPFAKHSFAMIMLSDVLEHLHDSPRNLLNDLLELATPQGLLCVTVPNAVNIRKRLDVLRGKTNLPPFASYYWYPGPWRGHVREYVRDDLTSLAEYLGLDVLELTACDHLLEKVPGGLRLLYLAVTRLCPGWKDSWLLVARKRHGWEQRKSRPDPELARLLAMPPTG